MVKYTLFSVKLPKSFHIRLIFYIRLLLHVQQCIFHEYSGKTRSKTTEMRGVTGQQASQPLLTATGKVVRFQ